MKIIQSSFEILDHSDLLRTIELGGRVCWKSEDKIEEGTAEPFIERIKNFKHECYDASTDVLTREGWRNWSLITLADELATLNSAGELEWQYPSKIFADTYEGPMLQVDTQGVNLLVTPNHRMFVCKTSTKTGRLRLIENYEFIEAAKLGRQAHAYIKTAQYKHPALGVELALASLLGFAIGDGNINGGNLYFNLKKQRKIQYLEELTLQLGIELRRGKQFALTIPSEYKSLFECIYKDGEKVIPKEALSTWGKTELHALFLGMLEADGSYGKTDVSYFTTSETLANQFQHLCLLVGLAGTLRYSDPPPNSFRQVAKRMYVITVLVRNLKPEVNKLKKNPDQTSWVHYKGNVFCAQVPNGTLYVRRKGIPVWCGNSVLEHGSITVRFVCDRGVSHELVRHRLASYSQESTRYCNYTKGKFNHEICVVEPSTSLGSALYNIWLAEMHRAEGAYFAMLEAGATPQVARAVLPQSLKTEVVMTANAREWRHVLKLRCDKAAHPDMRALMLEVRDEFASRWPVFFGDI